MTLLLVACYAYFIAGIGGSLFSLLAQKLFGPSTLFTHGKAAKVTLTDKASWIAKLTVAKHFFRHFYAFGLLASIAFCILRPVNLLPVVLLAIQCFRRLLECFTLMPGAKGSQMHLIHYFIGLSYYPMLLLSFHFQEQEYSNLLQIYPWIALFITASGFQCYCHWVLGSARANLTRKNAHKPVNNFIFKFIHAPHYFAELLVYFAIAGLFRSHPLSLLNLIWIITVLGVSAKNSSDWLCDTWKYKSHKEFCKYLMIPFLF